MIERVISRGQTGADQTGLLATALYVIKTGDWMPKGFLTKTGPRPDLAELYGVREHATSDKYSDRIEPNVRQSDGTIRFAAHFGSRSWPRFRRTTLTP